MRLRYGPAGRPPQTARPQYSPPRADPGPGPGPAPEPPPAPPNRPDRAGTARPHAGTEGSAESNEMWAKGSGAGPRAGLRRGHGPGWRRPNGNRCTGSYAERLDRKRCGAANRTEVRPGAIRRRRQDGRRRDRHGPDRTHRGPAPPQGRFTVADSRPDIDARRPSWECAVPGRPCQAPLRFDRTPGFARANRFRGVRRPWPRRAAGCNPPGAWVGSMRRRGASARGGPGRTPAPSRPAKGV